MKKMLVLVAVALLLVPASAMAGMTAFMNMDELSSKEMAATTGQAGISLSIDTSVAMAYAAWGDEDGCATAGTAGWVSLQPSAITLSMDDILIDACTTGAGTSYLVIDTNGNTITTSVDTMISIQATNAAPIAANSLGRFVASNVQVSNTVIKVAGH